MSNRPTSGAPPGASLRRSSARAEWFAERFEALVDNVEGFIKGKTSVVRLALVCMMGGGHLLIDDIPGVGKTSLAKAIANSFGGSWNRIQFTPDLLPSDVLGVQVYRMDTHEFDFRAGPIFANVVVADEINRATPKTQSALLEVMEERQVTVDGTTYLVPKPFLVIATQNPIDFDGTYALPEAEIDRFMMQVELGYPGFEYEVEIIGNRAAGQSVDSVRAVIDVQTAEEMTAVVREIYVAPSLLEYIVSLSSATRKLEEVRLGASPRGSLAVVICAKAFAAAHGSGFATVDDVKAVAPHVLRHRLLLTPEAELNGQTADSLLGKLAAVLPVPDERY